MGFGCSPPTPTSALLSTTTTASSSSSLPLLTVRSTERRRHPSLSTTTTTNNKFKIISGLSPDKPLPSLPSKSPWSLLPLGVVLTSIVELPAFSVTGNNNYEQDLTLVLIQSGITAAWYFILMPPIIMNWLRLRWYKRKFLEMYLQFMCVFLFFPGIILWAPFLNFRRLPRDPNMKYPWSTSQDDAI